MKEVNPLLWAKPVISATKRKALRATIPSFLSNDKVVSIGDVTRDDSQRRFLAQNIVAMLEQCCNNVVTIRNNVAAMLQRCVALKIKSSLQIVPSNITLSLGRHKYGNAML